MGEPLRPSALRPFPPRQKHPQKNKSIPSWSTFQNSNIEKIRTTLPEHLHLTFPKDPPNSTAKLFQRSESEARWLGPILRKDMEKAPEIFWAPINHPFLEDVPLSTINHPSLEDFPLVTIYHPVLGYPHFRKMSQRSNGSSIGADVFRSRTSRRKCNRCITWPNTCQYPNTVQFQPTQQHITNMHSLVVI